MTQAPRHHELAPGYWLAAGALVLAVCTDALGSPIDQLSDLTGKVSVVVTLKGRDNFNSEYRYDVSAKNISSETFAGDSLFIVLEKVTNIGGEERENLNSDPILSRMDVLGQEGETSDGKPYFRIPAGANPDLVPYSQSLPVNVRLRNKDYLIVFTPSFKVYGMRRPPPESKQQPQAQSNAPRNQAQERQTEKLIQLLLKKGVITEEEWRKANQP
jgi:hypothetical protein